MAPPRKTFNGRSPLVNKQHQITSFFSKSPINPNSSSIPKSQNPNPNLKTDNSPNTSTPSPNNVKRKPGFIIGSQNLHWEEVIDRRIKVFCPLNKTWNEGYVKVYDKTLGKYIVQYDDVEEDFIDLNVDKFEFVDEVIVNKKFKRLRKASKVVVDNSSDEDVKESVAEKLKKKRVEKMWEEGVGESEDVEEKLKRRRGEKMKKDGFVVSEFGTKVAASVKGN